MPVDNYAPCPCGSGKKFKWCCQPFYGEIEKAFQQQQNQQADAALRTMEELTQKFPENPEVWGRRAELLWENGQLELAEHSVDKALELNANYPFGLFLRGMFRHEEGQPHGALLLYRKAAALCDPETRGMLGEIHMNIGQCESMINHPIAAIAAYEIARLCLPQNEDVQGWLDAQREPGRFPSLVTQPRSFKKPSVQTDSGSWARALASAQTGKLSDAAAAYEKLTREFPEEPAAWHNLGLARAWLGENPAAVEAFGKYLELEADEEQASDAWAFAEALRLGPEMIDSCDYLEHGAYFQIRDARVVAQALNDDKRFVDLHQAQGVVGGSLIDRDMPAVHENLALFELPQVIAYVVIIGTQELRLLHQDPNTLEKGQRVVQELMGPALGEMRLDKRPTAFQQLASNLFRIRLPQGVGEEHGRRLILGELERHFEEHWIQRPLKSLNGIRPIDAAGHQGLRKKLLGVVKFQEEIVRLLPFPYNFNRLRTKLGLPMTAQPAPAAAAAVSRDLSALGAAELAGLKADELKDEELLVAFQTALRLDAEDLAEHFAQILTERPGGPADRYQVFQHLIRAAAERNDFPQAQGWVDAGLQYDCEHNEGRRRNDYELRRARLYLESKEPEQAFVAFRALVERTPSNLDALGAAAEAMLSVKERARAVQFAELGLNQAKQKGDRDRIGYFQELLVAAKRG
jgi:tetratricopeptide (TPR) repeat protein